MVTHVPTLAHGFPSMATAALLKSPAALRTALALAGLASSTLAAAEDEGDGPMGDADVGSEAEVAPEEDECAL